MWRDRRNLLFAPSQEEFTLPAALLLVDDDDDEDDEAATITSENIDPREDYLDKEAHHARIGRERNVLLEAFEEKVRQQPQLLDDPLARVIDPMTERELLDINVSAVLATSGTLSFIGLMRIH